MDRDSAAGVLLGHDPDTLVEVSTQSSAITHYDPRCTYGCAILNLTIAGYLQEESDPLASALDYVTGDAPDELVETLRLVPDVVDTIQVDHAPGHWIMS